jgi:hypothetical protein
MSTVQYPVLGPKINCQVLLQRLQAELQQVKTEINYRHWEYLRGGASECPDCGEHIEVTQEPQRGSEDDYIQFVKDHPGLAKHYGSRQRGVLGDTGDLSSSGDEGSKAGVPQP